MATFEQQIQEIAEYHPCAHLSARKVASMFAQSVDMIENSVDNLSSGYKGNRLLE